MKNHLRIITSLFILLVSLFWIVPILLIFINSFKPYNQIIQQFFALPESISLKMYVETWIDYRLAHLFANTIVYTVLTIIGLVILAPMAAYKLARTRTRSSHFMFILIILPIMVPFQAYMISLTRFGSIMGFTGTGIGYILVNIGLYVPLSVFMIHGFVKSIPIEMDECATIDGASPLRTYRSIIFPLLIPIIITVIIINSLAVWNDIIVNMLIVGGKESLRNLQTALYMKFSTQQTDWEHALPGLVMAVIPNIIFFIFMQKYIVEGISAGAVKG